MRNSYSNGNAWYAGNEAAGIPFVMSNFFGGSVAQRGS